MSARETESQIAQLYAVIDKQNSELEALRSLADDLVKWYEDDFIVNEGDETINRFYDRARKLRSGSGIA